MSDEVSWGLSQNHCLARPLAGFKGKTELGSGQPAWRLLGDLLRGAVSWAQAVAPGMWKDKSQPTLGGRATSL